MGRLRHLPEGADFGPEHFASERDFGFSGSARHGAVDTVPSNGRSDDATQSRRYEHESGQEEKSDNSGASTIPQLAKGGSMGHPNGHKVVRVENKPDGTVVMHHAHGGFSVCHADGGMTHHGHDGEPVMARGQHNAGEGTFVSRMGGQDHDKGEHMARGGRHIGLPRGMTPKAGHGHAIGNEVAMNRPPRSPKRSPTTRNNMPGDDMAYGVEPGSEPDVPPGGDGGTPMLRRGGSA